MLDTVNPFGGSEGSIDATQLAWLTAQLKAGSRHYLDESGHIVRGGHHDRLFVIFSHHTIGSMDNAAGVGRVLGPAVRDLLLRFPNVVLWVNGHTHRNTVTPYSRAAGATAPGGFWEVNTAAHIDWPQQARTVELVDNRDGTLSIFGTIVDHAGPTSYGDHPKSPLELASALPRARCQRLAGGRVTGRDRRAPRTARGPQRRAPAAGAVPAQPPTRFPSSPEISREERNLAPCRCS